MAPKHLLEKIWTPIVGFTPTLHFMSHPYSFSLFNVLLVSLSYLSTILHYMFDSRTSSPMDK
jgi:hypothetical protein